MKDLNMNPKYYNPRELRGKISSAKNELITPEQFKKHEFDEKIVTLYKKYCEKLKQGNSVDFDDLLILPIKLFKLSPNILTYYQEKYKYILIDEYQDTNEAQYVFSKLLSQKYHNIFVVGDNDQAIYAFEEILNIDSSNQYARFAIFACYMFKRDFEIAYNKLIELYNNRTNNELLLNVYNYILLLKELYFLF